MNDEARGRWSVRSITAQELPASCRYCRPRPKPEQARAVIEYGDAAGLIRRSVTVCVDHAVYVQQKYVLASSQAG